jgi:putative ATP-binding cassette transporter
MLWVAILYAVIGTWLTFYIGRPLAGLNYTQQRYEANFRYSLVRLRENSESIAFYKGEAQEQQVFLSRVIAIVDNWWQIMRRQKKLNWFSSGYGQIANIFPFIVVAPRYFAGKIQLGGLMQTVSAFNAVQNALSYFINAFTDIASWKAVANRLTGFNESIEKAQAMMPVAAADMGRQAAERKAIEARGLTVRLPDGRALLEHIDLTIKPGDSLLVTGASGAGKSTLLRALAGLWPFVEGSLLLPDARMLFVPQKPYLPLGTLAQALCYPGAADIADAQLREVLSLVQLGHLADRLADTEQWSNVLSLGEQQRVAFARILLARPDFVFMDEATSALDEATEAHLYGMLKEKLPGAALISVGHRSTLRAWHAAEMTLGGKP